MTAKRTTRVAAHNGGYLRVGADQRISLNVTGFSADTAAE